MTEEGLLSQTLYTPAGQKMVPTLKFYMNPDATLDVLYDKAFIRTAGLCQSLLFEVPSPHES